MVLLTIHCNAEGACGVRAPFIKGYLDHPWIQGGSLFGLTSDDAMQVVYRRAYFASDTEVVDAVDVLRPRHLLEDLRDLRVALFQRFLGKGLIFEIGNSL